MVYNSAAFFSQDKKFWDAYNRGRPAVPDSFFARIFAYHEAKVKANTGGSPTFGTIHDVGAGNAPFAAALRSRFSHVIISDILPSNVQLARERLGGGEVGPGTDGGFSFRVAGIADDHDIPPGSVDMVFATNVMHFADPQEDTMAVIARQLRPGGTFAAAGFAGARFYDADLQQLWERIAFQIGRVIMDAAPDANQDAILRSMNRTSGTYDVAPLPVRPDRFEPGAQRIRINMAEGDGMFPDTIPPEERYRVVGESWLGADDVETTETDEDWTFEMDLAGVKEHFGSFPFLLEPHEAFVDLFRELDEIMAGGRRVKGYFPVKLILATRAY